MRKRRRASLARKLELHSVSSLTEYALAKDLQKVTEFVKRYGKPYDPQDDNYKRDPFASDVRAGKNTCVFRWFPILVIQKLNPQN